MTLTEVKQLTNTQLLNQLGFSIKCVRNTTEGLHNAVNKIKSYPFEHDEALCVCEFAQRWNEKRLRKGSPFSSSKQIYDHFRFQLRDEKQECSFIVLLDNRHQYMEEQLISKGILNRSLVHPREVFSPALLKRAAAMICVHNHPSGNPIASQEDIEVTRRLTEVGKVMGIPVLDHIIIGNDQYFSLSDHNLL